MIFVLASVVKHRNHAQKMSSTESESRIKMQIHSYVFVIDFEQLFEPSRHLIGQSQQ